MKLAAVDVGSNAIRLALRSVDCLGVVSGHGYRRYAVRLGGDVFSTGRVGPGRRTELLTAMADIARRLERAEVERYRAVATSALREAQNGNTVVRQVSARTGVRLELIDGLEELALVRGMLTRAVGDVPPDTLLIDLGGGSLELDRVGGRGARSLPLGTVRLLERFPGLAGKTDAPTLAAARAAVDSVLERRVQRPWRPPLAIGTGGNLDVLAHLLSVPGCAVPAIDVFRLGELVGELASQTASQRAAAYDLRRDRADLIVAAALIIESIVRRFGLNAFVVPGTGLREGLLYELMPAPPADAAARAALLVLGQDPGPAQDLLGVATRIFNILSPVHELWAPAKAIVAAAVLLRDVGRHLDPAQRPAHVVRFILSLPGLPLDQPARRVAAYAAAASLGAMALADTLKLSAKAVRVGRIVAGVILLAEALRPVGPERLSVDLLGEPLVVTCHGAQGAVQADAGVALSAALSRALRVV